MRRGLGRGGVGSRELEVELAGKGVKGFKEGQVGWREMRSGSGEEWENRLGD